MIAEYVQVSLEHFVLKWTDWFFSQHLQRWNLISLVKKIHLYPDVYSILIAVCNVCEGESIKYPGMGVGRSAIPRRVGMR